MHCPDCGAEYETSSKREFCEKCETKLELGARDKLTIDGQTADGAIKAFQEGAKKILSQLKSWEIGVYEAKRLERNAREMWYDDADNIGIPKQKANEIWQEKIIDEILSEDPAFSE